MEKINTELLISTLFKLGFDKIDPLLFTYTLGKITKDGVFSFKEQDTSIAFKKYVDFFDGFIRLKDGYSLDTNISCNESITITIGQSLFGNRYLFDYLSNYDFTDIILKKVEAYDIETTGEVKKVFFSKKEIDILNKYQSDNGNALIKKQQNKI